MKSQTATEYLVITAVVIIIALIVVGSLGGIPGIGGGISEQAARAALSSQPVAITDYSVDTFKTVFTIRNNEPYMIRVDDVYIDGRRCWLQGGHSSPERFIQLRSGSSVQVQCNSVTSIDAYSYPIEVRYTNVQTNTQRTQRGSDLQLVGSASSFECPSGFVPVPGGFVLADGTTVDDFCVMKYEAKNVGGVPVSQPDGIPWLLPNENSKSQAKDLCEQNGYSLLSSRQWMQINENILHTPINNLDSSQPEIFLARGNVDESGAYGAVLDSGTADCDLSVSLDHVNNDDCPLRVEGYVGMSYTWDSVQRDHKRIFVLSNGEVIWDWVGNADNIIEFDVSSVSGPSGGYYYVLYPGDLSNDYCDNFDTGLTEYCYDYILSFFPYLKPSIFNFQNGGAFGGDLVQFDGFGKVGSNHYMYGGFLGVDIFGGFWGSLSDDGFRCTYTP